MSGEGSMKKQVDMEIAESTAVLPKTATPGLLPMYRVILHNDDENEVEHVIETIIMLTPLNAQDAIERTLEAHHSGCSLLLVIHRERAELYAEQFLSRSLDVTIEPDD